MTRPFLTFPEKACLILPARQKCADSARFARLSVLPLTFGTTQGFGLGFGMRLKVAVTPVAAFMVTAQEPVPEQPPDQPANVEPLAGAAVKVTVVPCVNGCEHVAPQSIPAGELVTEPDPVPALETVSVSFGS